MKPRRSTPAATASPAASRSDGDWARAPQWLFLGLAAYFLLHLFARTLVSNNLQADEAEQLLMTQDWRWGYGSQGPLYTWIQKLLFECLGTNVFALSLLKNVLLFALYGFVYLAAREILGRRRLAVIATASVLLIPNIAWESQRDQTHLILATATSAATLFVFVRLLKTRRAGYFALFGALIGIGTLSKYNYLVFPLSLILAAVSVRELRSAFWSGKLLLTLAALAVVAGPHLCWMVHHQELAASQSVKFKMAAGQAGIEPYLVGGLGFLKIVAVFLAAPALIFAPLIHAAHRGRDAAPAEAQGLYQRFLLRTLLAGLALGLVTVLLFRVTSLKERWLEPLLFAAPILLTGWAAPALERGRSGKVLLGLSGAAGLAVLVAINGTVLFAEVLNRDHHLNIPYSALAKSLQNAGFNRGTIIAWQMPLGGNLKMQFQNTPVIVPALPYDLPLPPGQKLIVWRANKSPVPSDDFLQFARRLCPNLPSSDLPIEYVEIIVPNGDEDSLKLGFMLLPE